MAPPSPVRNPASEAIRWLEVDGEHAGQRLDNFLLATLKGVPKSHIYRIVRRGEVRINKGRARPDYRLNEGDIVRIPPLRTADTDRRAPAVVPERYRALEARILYEDDGLLILDKPSGMAVHGGSGIRLGVIETLRLLRPRSRSLELAHRLDRDTSGCLVVAKKRSVLKALHALLRESGESGMDKRYQALVQGGWRGGERRVNAPLQKSVLRSGERLVRVSEQGKASVSIIAPLRRFREATLVEVRLLTGRTHQARVHAAHLGKPIAGDDKYGNKEFNQRMREYGLRRLFLHAASLSFIHPASGTRLHVEAPLPAELTEILDKLSPTDEKGL
jgi:23S rRNA pseudouridine955/2504/2580 synthase